MSLNISYFLPKPLFFKDRDIRPIYKEDISSCVIDDEKGVTIIKFVQRSSKSDKIYDLVIELDTVDTITTQTNVKVHCNCANFKYQCKTLLWHYDALHGDVEDRRLPKKQSKPYVCKHLYSAILLMNKLNNVGAIKQLAGD